MSVNTEVVVLLTQIAIDTLTEAIEKRDTTVIRMADGSQPTADQIETLMGFTTEDIDAAQALMHHHLEIEQQRADNLERIVDLFTKYSTGPGDTTAVIFARMNDEDQEEFLHLVEVTA